MLWRLICVWAVNVFGSGAGDLLQVRLDRSPNPSDGAGKPKLEILASAPFVWVPSVVAIVPNVTNYYKILGSAKTVPIRTVNRQCSSSLQAVAEVAAAIKAGLYDIGSVTFSSYFISLLVSMM